MGTAAPIDRRIAVPTVLSPSGLPGHQAIGWRWMAALCLAGFAACFVATLLCTGRDVGLYDEGSVLVGAWRVLLGEVPHRDFYAIYGPAQSYALAALFEMFGRSVLVERIWDAGARSTIPPLCCLIVASFGAKRPALAVGAGALAWVATIGYPGYPVFPAFACVLASLHCLTPMFGPNPRWVGALAAGAFCGLAFLFRYDVGIVLLGLEGGVLVLWATARRSSGGRWGGGLPLLAAWIVGAGVPVAALLAVYAKAGVFHAFFEQVFVVQSKIYVPMRSLPSPGLSDILHEPVLAAVYLPLMAALAVAAALPEALRHRNRQPTAWLLLTFGLATIALFAKGVVRISTIHMIMAIVMSLVVCGLLVAAQPIASRSGRAALAALASLALGVTLLQIMSQVGATLDSLGELRRGELCPASPRPPELGCFSVDADHLAAIALVRSLSAEGEPIFVGLGRHDKIVQNDIAFYFLADRLPATGWSHMDPGVETTEKVQREIVADLVRNCVAVVALDGTWDGVTELNASAISSGVTVLDDFLRANYRPVGVFGMVSVNLATAEARAAFPASCPATRSDRPRGLHRGDAL